MLRGRMERMIENLYNSEYTEKEFDDIKRAIRTNYIRGFISKEDRDYLYKLLK